MKILMQYIGQNYITLMLLLGIIIVMSANRHAKLDGTKYIYAIIAFVFILTISEYAEYLCDTYNQSVRILYAKAAVSYLTEPLLVILELCLILPHKHNKLLFVPYFIESALVITDLFGTDLIYGYHADHSFISGPLHFVPAVVLCFYIIMLMQYSIEFIQQKDYSKAMIVIFISFTTMITVFLEYWNIITDHTTDIAAFDILIYYFYLAAIHHSRVQDKLHKSRLELEHTLIVRVHIDIERVDHRIQTYKKQQEAKDSYNSIDGGIHKSNRFTQHTFASIQLLTLGELCFFTSMIKPPDTRVKG